MGFFSKFFRGRTVGGPHRIHPDDETLVDESDVAWFSQLTAKDISQLGAEDDVHKTAAFLKFKDEGMSPEEAARQVWKYFPYYYVDPQKRSEGPPGLNDLDAKLPFLVKDKVNRMAMDGTLSKELAENSTTMNATIRTLLRGV